MSRWAWPLVVLLIALAARLGYPMPAPFFDEFFHALAARSLLHDGTMNLAPQAPQPYTRAAAFTWLVAGSYQLFGESWSAGRLPSQVAGSLLVMGLFIFVRREAGAGAAWLASMLLCFVPEYLYLSNWTRFYSLQMLAVFVGAAALYRTVWPIRVRPTTGVEDSSHGLSQALHTERGHWGRRGMYAAVSVAAFSLAVHLQPTALIAVAAAGAWMVLLLGWCWYGPRALNKPRPGGRFYLSLLLIAAVAIAVAWQTGLLHDTLDAYHRPRLWAMAHSDDAGYYQRTIMERRPVLWVMFPAAVITAAAVRPALGSFAAILFTAAFLAHSFIWIKAMRYLSYAQPFFFIVAGVALSAWLRALAGQVRAVWMRATARRWPGAGRWIAAAGVGVTVAFGAYRTNDYYLALQAYRGDLRALPYHHVDWEAAVAALRPWFDRADVVISAVPVKTLYYFGDYDYMINRSTQGANPEGSAYKYDGRPMLSEAASLARLQARPDCSRGLILVEEELMRWPAVVTPGIAQWILTHTEPIALPGAPGVQAYWWGPKPENLSNE